MNLALPVRIPHRDRQPMLGGGSVLAIAGTRIELRTDQPFALAPFLAAHRHFDAGGRGETLRVNVLAGGIHADAPRIQFPDLAPAEVRGLIDRGTDGRFEYLHARDGDRVFLYRDRLLDLTPAMIQCPEGCDVIEPRLLGSYLELMLLNAALERAPGLAAAHAGVVAHKGQAALVCGDSGAGKTTLTLALLRQGCAYLSDEVALVDRATGTVAAYPRSLGIRAGGLALLGNMPLGSGAFQATSLTGDRKWYADPGAAAPAGVCHRAGLRHLWFLVGFGPEPRITASDPWQAAQRFARSLRHVQERGMHRLWTAMEVVRRCRPCDIVVGSPEATARVLMQLMEEEGGPPIA
jgi:hypothetical protein